MLNKILLVVLIALPIQAQAQTFLFTYDDIYKEPLADIRTPDSGVSINTSTYREQRISYFEASLGNNLSILTYKYNDLLLQFDIEAGFWATLGYNEGAFPLLTQDFIFAFPLEFRWGNFSGAIKFNHISAHLGDGFSPLLEEELSENKQDQLDEAEGFLEDYLDEENVDITLKEPSAYSRDFLSADFAYDYKIKEVDSKLYGKIGYAHKIVPDDLDRLFVGMGFESVYETEYFSPYGATDFTYHQDTDTVDWSSELGTFINHDDSFYSFRVALTSYIGSDRRGQLLGRNLKQFGIGFFIR